MMHDPTCATITHEIDTGVVEAIAAVDYQTSLFSRFVFQASLMNFLSKTAMAEYAVG